MRRALALGVVLVILTPSLALGAKPIARGPVHGWAEPVVSRFLQNPVEQQPFYDSCGMIPDPSRTDCVTNPTACAWDPDDSITGFVAGKRIEAGETESWSVCIVGDWSEHLLYAESDAVGLKLAIDGVIEIEASGGQGCIVGPDYDRDAITLGILQEIPGSNGGFGRIHTFTVTATADRKLSAAGVSFGVSLAESRRVAEHCATPDPWPAWQRVGAYPGPSARFMP